MLANMCNGRFKPNIFSDAFFADALKVKHFHAPSLPLTVCFLGNFHTFLSSADFLNQRFQKTLPGIP